MLEKGGFLTMGGLGRNSGIALRVERVRLLFVKRRKPYMRYEVIDGVRSVGTMTAS
jgi:hypothetical protein